MAAKAAKTLPLALAPVYRTLSFPSTKLGSCRLFSLLSSLFIKKKRQQPVNHTKSETFKPNQSFFVPQPSYVLTAQRQSLFDPNVDPPKRIPHPILYVYGLNKSTTKRGLREAFSKFGEVVYAKVILDHYSRKSRGFGYVKYATTEEAAKGIKGMDGQFLDGWIIFTEYARCRKRRKKNTAKLPQNNGEQPNQLSEKTIKENHPRDILIRAKTAMFRLKMKKKKLRAVKRGLINKRREKQKRK